MYRKIMTTVFLIAIVSCLLGQDKQYQFAGKHKYSQGILQLRDNTKIQVINLVIENDHISYKKKSNKQSGQYELSDLYLIRVTNGTQALRYAMYGGAVAGLAAALGLAQAGSDPFAELPEPGPFIGGFAAAGAIIGGLVGAGQTKWKTIYVAEVNKISPK